MRRVILPILIALWLTCLGNGWGVAPGVAETECDLPAGDPDPATDRMAWEERDLQNVRCAMQRSTDQLENPAHTSPYLLSIPPTYFDNLYDQLLDPTRPRLTIGQLFPTARAGDPYRIPEDWERSGRGRVQEVSFIASSGAKLVGRLFTPSSAGPASLPGIVITTGSIQGYQEMYNWAAEGLAEAGYMVLTFDVQGQGHSETFPHDSDGSPACSPSGCEGVPFQSDVNFQQGTRDALAFLLSSPEHPYSEAVSVATGANAEGTNPYNPLWRDIDAQRIGLAGHSLGAFAVSTVGQEDSRVGAIVAWDALEPVPEDQVAMIHAPALSLGAEYFYPPRPSDPSSPPSDANPSPERPANSALAGFEQLKTAGIDTMLVTLRSSTHLEFSYNPYMAYNTYASRYGERGAMYFTLAWFDRYLKGEAAAGIRLTALSFDDSADQSSIGTGTFDTSTGKNVPYEIAGQCVANRLSFYYSSRYWLEAGAQASVDMRTRGC